MQTTLDKEFFRKAMFHVTVTLAHGVVFFFVCHAFSELAAPTKAPGGATGAQLAVRFVAIYAGLLTLNAVWLYSITPADDAVPGRIWARSNTIAAGLVICLLGIFWHWSVSDAALVGVACAIFLANSAYDLLKCPEYYFRFEPL